MAGLSKVQEVINSVRWPDAELNRVQIDYQDLRLDFIESSGRNLTLVCEGYIGYELCGFWDEAVIQRVDVTESGDFLNCCLKSIGTRLGDLPPPSGSRIRNQDQAMQLVMRLDDGCELKVAMKGLRLDRPI